MFVENLRRSNDYVDPDVATTRTVNFVESTPVGTDHILIAGVHLSTATAITTPTGWTPLGTGGANSANQLRLFWRRGDSSTNGITVTSDSAVATIFIAALDGYAGMTPIISGGGNGTTGTQFPFSGVSGQPGNGVAIYGIGLPTAPAGWGSWSSGQPIPSAARQQTIARAWWALSDYIDGAGAANSTVNWGGSRSQRYIAAVIPLAAVAAPAPTANVVTVLPGLSAQALSGTVEAAPTYPTGTIASLLPGLSAQALSGTVTSGSTAPAAKYGPTGLHWPDNTPLPSATFGYDVEIAATWAAMASAINAANTSTNMSKVARIKVAPGSLTGNGAGATATPVLESVGMVDRPGGRILIVPRDGVGTVNVIDKSPRFLDVRGVSIMGINTWMFGQAQADSGGVLCSGCKDFAYGWARARFWNVGNRSDVITDRVQFVELVADESFLYPEPDENGEGSGAADRHQWYNSTSGGSGASGQADRVEVIGCFSAPVRVWGRDGAHLDGLQIYGTGAFTNVRMKDSVMYAASHQGFIVNEPTTVTVNHSLMIGGDTANDTQFPLEPNAAVPTQGGAPWPTNGAPTLGRVENETLLFGSPKGWPTEYDSTSSSQSRTSKAWLDANAPVPTEATMRAMWAPLTGGGGTTPVPVVEGTATSKLPSISTAASGTVSVPVIIPPGGTTVPSQAEMPTAPFELYPVPQMEWIVGSAPSGAGFISVGPTHELVKVVHAGGKGTIAGSVSGFVTAQPLQDISGAGTGTNPLVYPPIGIRVRVDSQVVYIRLGQRSYSGFSNVSARAASRLKVNDKWTSLTPVYLGTTIGYPSNPENITAGEYALKLTFPTAEMRDIELTTHLEFGGIVVPDTANGQVAQGPRHVLALMDGSLGGSEKHQTGNFSLNGSEGSGAPATYTAVSSYIWSAAQSLGYDVIVNGGSGSSGFSISGDTVSFKSSNKVPKDLIEHLPDTIIVGSANNDQAAGQSASQVATASELVYSSIKASARTGALLVALGMFTAPAMGTQAQGEAAVAPFNVELKAAALRNGFWFVNPTTGQTFDPQGNLRLTTSNWVYAALGDVSSDNTHPTQKGAHNLGLKLANAIRMAHPETSTSPTFVPLTRDRGALSWNSRNRGVRDRKSKYRGGDTKISTW